MAEVLQGEKEEDADWRPRIDSSFVSLLTRTMLANSLEIMLRLSAIFAVDGNDSQLAEKQPKRVICICSDPIT